MVFSPSWAQKAVKSLYASASDAQRELLTQLGIAEPAEQPPDLAALCKQHISSLPEDIRKLVEEPPEKPPTPQEVMSEKSRQFKVATADLRGLIFKKSALQLRLNKHKDQYTSMLEDMHGINEKLDARQKEVSSLQLELQSSVNDAPAPEALPDAAEALVKQVEAMDADDTCPFQLLEGDTKISSKSATNVIQQLQWDDGTNLLGEEWRAELLAHPTKANILATDKLSCIRAQIAAVQSEHLRHDSERYQSWLEGAKVKGMRPLYRAIRSHEEVLVRPINGRRYGAASPPLLLQLL
eukprot:s9743_g1.t1